MKASIIIPSYNACERLYLNLISLNYQDCSREDFEVIVIDNGSSDATGTMLSNFKANFHLKTVRVAENRGIARGRNKGIPEASGQILIFHDSDMIAAKDFVRKHIKAHEKENMVVCGLPWLRIYSYFYSSFAPYQLEDLNRKIGDYDISTENWKKDKYQLIAEAQIRDGSLFNLCFDLDTDFISSLKETLITFGGDLEEYNLPWRFFITNNASVDRKKVIDAGMFDENIIKYGFEDYDLGFRLHKAGGQFKLCYDIVGIHQEHPKNVTAGDVIENLNYICKKYNNIDSIDMILLCLSCITPTDHQVINGVMSDIKLMHHKRQYTFILNIFLKILQTAMKVFLNQDMSFKSAARSEIDLNLSLIRKQLKELLQRERMLYFPGVFSAMAKSIFSIDLLL